MFDMENGDDLISISEAARIAGTSRNGIYLGIKREELTPIPSRVMLSRKQVEAWAQREKSKGGYPKGRPRKSKGDDREDL